MVRSTLQFFAILALLSATSPAWAISVSTIENFNTDAANWKQNNKANTANFAASGGPNGASDSYITSSFNLAKTTTAQVVFRANSTFGSSGGAFVGDWLAAGADTLSFWFKDDAPGNLTVGARVAPIGGFPGLSYIVPVAVVPNTWTKVTIPLDPSSPNWNNAEGAGATIPEAVTNAFSSVDNLQIFVIRDAALIPENTTANFSLDKVSVVPEPSTWILAGAGALGAALLVRRRQAA